MSDHIVRRNAYASKKVETNKTYTKTEMITTDHPNKKINKKPTKINTYRSLLTFKTSLFKPKLPYKQLMAQ